MPKIKDSRHDTAMQEWVDRDPYAIGNRDWYVKRFKKLGKSRSYLYRYIRDNFYEIPRISINAALDSPEKAPTETRRVVMEAVKKMEKDLGRSKIV